MWAPTKVGATAVSGSCKALAEVGTPAVSGSCKALAEVGASSSFRLLQSSGKGGAFLQFQAPGGFLWPLCFVIKRLYECECSGSRVSPR